MKTVSNQITPAVLNNTSTRARADAGRSRRFSKPCATLAVALLVFVPTVNQAAPLSLSEEPLAVATFVAPNIMYLIDNSGSMNNIVPDVPFDPAVTYFTCPAGIIIGATTPVDIRILSDGSAFFNVNSGGTDYDWGTNTTGTGITGKSKRCFDPAVSYTTVRLHGNSPDPGIGSTKSPSGYLSAAYSGNYLNWFFGTAPTNWGTDARKKPGTQTRMEIAQQAANGLLDSLAALKVRVGLASYKGSTGAQINQVMDDISTNLTSMKASITALSPTGSTPLAESLRDLGEYFAVGQTGNLTMHPGQSIAGGDKFDQAAVTKGSLFARGYTFTPPATAPIQNFCQKNFAVLMTDGRPQSDQDIGTPLRDYDGDCIGATPACLTFDRKSSRTYESAGSDYLDDVALALFDIDLRPDLNDLDGVAVKNNIETYTIGFADDQVINDPLMQDTADNGNGLFLTAKNAGELSSVLASTFLSISGKTGSAAAVAVNSRSLNTETRIFQALYTSGEWSGNLVALPILPDGSVGTEVWNAKAALTTQSSGAGWDTGRKILSFNGTQGVDFRWPADIAVLTADDLSSSQVVTLRTNPVTSALEAGSVGSDRLDFLRGNHSLEQRNGGNFRNRPSDFVLGDIVDATPVFVGAPPAMPDLEIPTHSTYQAAKAARKQMIYVGSNDGMLHGFNAATGAEEIAYVPNLTFSNLNQLTNPSYSHKFFVNGPPFVGDAFFGSAWHTMLVGSLGRGGKGIYALDVSDPEGTNTAALQFVESNAADIVKWEFTDADMGFSYGQPSIAKMHNGQWAAIFGNGYNSANEKPILYIVNIETGAIIRKIDLSNGTIGNGNGLSAPAVVDEDGDFVADFIFAGDLLGNMWKIDVRASTGATPENSWGSFFTGASSADRPLFQATDGTTATTVIQPITERPEITRHPDRLSGFMVYFGTGKYIEGTDATATASPIRTFYGIWDENPNSGGIGASLAKVDRADLLPQTLTQDNFDVNGNATIETSETGIVRTVTNTAIVWRTANVACQSDGTGTCLGWRVNLNITGEMSVSNPVFLGGSIPRIIFTTLIPNDVACSFGGSGWLLELHPRNGGQLDGPAFDLNGDGVFNNLDTVGGAPVAGFMPNLGIMPEPVIIHDTANKTIIKPITGSKGIVKSVKQSSGGTPSGRQSWRQLR